MSDEVKSYFVMNPEWMTDPRPIPEDVRRVEGCNCGGRVLHRVDCTINALPEADAVAAIEAADQRVQAFVSEAPWTT